MNVLLNYADTYAPAFAFLVLIFRLRKVDSDLYPIFLYLFITPILYGITNWYADRRLNNLFLYHYITLFDFLLISYFIRINLVQQWKKYIVYILSGLFILFFFINFLFFEPISKFPSNLICVECIFLLVLSFLFLIDLIEVDQKTSVKYQFRFWAVLGILLYSTVCFFIFFIYKYGAIDTFFRKMTWKIQEVMILIKFGLFIIGLLCQRKV